MDRPSGPSLRFYETLHLRVDRGAFRVHELSDIRACGRLRNSCAGPSRVALPGVHHCRPAPLYLESSPELFHEGVVELRWAPERHSIALQILLRVPRLD